MTAVRMTTIKVPVALRERLALDAAGEGLTAAAFLAQLLAERDRQRRFAAVRAAYAAAEDGSDDGQTRAWDGLAGDGLDQE